jgi:N-acetylglutamate synthase-like GNAT family acetyltransferase
MPIDMMTVRYVTTQDLPALQKLLKALDLFQENFNFEDTLVAEEKGRFIGLAHIRTVDGHKELTHVGVLPAYRRRGIARKLVETLLKDVNDTVFLNTIEPDFFLKLGFIRTEDFPKQFRKPAGWCDQCIPERCTPMVKRKTV